MFVAIVWGVAASYVAFEVAALRAMNLALAYPGLFGGVVLPKVVSESTSCEATPSEGRGERTTSAGRAGAFALGVSVGHEAVFRQWARSNPALIEPLDAEVQKTAASLGVASPGSFVPQRLAEANQEFIGWIEADDRSTARQLAGRYGPEACHAYKLGAAWGYSEVVRMALPSYRAVFGVEIRYYARQIPIPDELVAPMLEPSSFPAGSAELESEMDVTRGRILAFLGDAGRSP
jgi:hypothetical protein